jgi:nicotinate-nucleotide adenylyltransferase
MMVSPGGSLGIFGGTFDPIHTGHLVAIEWVAAQLGLNTVMIVPAGSPRLKDRDDVSSAAHRLAMTELAIAGNARLGIDPIEIAAAGPSSTLQTLRSLQIREPRARLVFILGLDALLRLNEWIQAPELLDEFDLIAMRRPGSEFGAEECAALNSISARAREAITVVDVPQIDISSRLVRRRVRDGLSIRYLVPDPVEHYIADHGLYAGRR